MKRIFAFLLALLMIFSICGCQKHKCPICEDLEGEPPIETATSFLEEEEMYDILMDSAVAFGWREEVVDIISRYVPDFNTIDTITSMGDGYRYVITMHDKTEYQMVIGEDGYVVSITYNVEIPTENDIIYVE